MSRDKKKVAASHARYWQSNKGKASRRRFRGSPAHRALQKTYRQKWQQSLRELIAKLKSVPCADCGGSFDPVCMDFDHREPGTKRDAVSKLFKRGEKAVLAEVAKCDVVCSNCHRLRTYRLRNHEEWRGAAQASKAVPVPQLELELPADVERQVVEQLR